MKQLIIIAILAIISFSVKGQKLFTNNSPCTLEIREVCIDVSGAPASCTVVFINGWQTVPPGSTVPLSSVFCLPPQEMGYEVRYSASTGCFASVIVKHVPTVCNDIPNTAYLPPCPSCSTEPIRVRAMSNGHDVKAD